MSTEDDRESWDYESGPFCQHWSEAAECDRKCVNCNHECSAHILDEGCWMDDCTCKIFVET